MNQKGISPILLLLVIAGVLIIGAGVWYYWVQKTPVGPGICPTDTKICPDGTAVRRISPACEFESCPEVKKDETTDWKVYRNEEYGFEIEYPSSFFFNECEECSYLLTIMSIGGAYGMEININPWLQDSVSLQDKIGKEKLTSYPFTEETINLDKIQATKIIKTVPLLSGPEACCGYVGPGQIIVIYAENKDVKYEIRGWINAEKSETYLPIYNQILSTLRFLE